MCGIYGILSFSGPPPERHVVERMGLTMRHRGPDDSGLLEDGELVFGMQRLSIIDVDGGHQPISNEDGTVVTVCNGEIYNFREIREDLQQRGHRFASGSDTEVIVHLYEEYGLDFVSRLSGMFGLALWDRTARRLVLARDRLGIKPLYICRQRGRLAFASEMKSILECPGIERRIDQRALEEYLALGYVPAPLTIVAGVEKLPPGNMLIAEDGQCRIDRYWRLPTQTAGGRDPEEWVSDIAATMEQSVVSQMVSDVPLGAFLSGGVDSSAVVAFMARNSDKPVKTYSIGFDTDTGGSYYNELPYARQVSQLFGTDHREIVVKPDVTGLLPELLWHMDEPVADAAFITTYLVSKFAREDVTVILSGVGGDELFGGYRRYWSEYLVRLYRRLPDLVRTRLLQPLGRALPSDRHSRLLDRSRLLKGFLAGAEMPSDVRYENYIRVFKTEQVRDVLRGADARRSGSIEAAFGAARTDDPVGRLIDVDMLTQLPDDLLMLTDRMSMATSLECRVPLLDDSLLELASTMPSALKVRRTKLKYALKKALDGVLPASIIHREKRGFGAPIGGWFKRELSRYLDGILNRDVVERRGLFDWQYVDRIRRQHMSNQEDHTDHLLSLMNLELWCRLYLDGEQAEAVTERMSGAGSI